MKRKLHIERVCASLIAAACALSVNAQVLKLESDKGPGLVPATMTANGKTRITTQDEAGIHIYNTNFLQEKVINYSPMKYRAGSREETATVTPTGAKISYYYVSGPAYFDGTISASTLEEARDKVAEYYGSDYTVVICEVEDKRFIHYYDGWTGSYSYYLYDLFGRQYPTSNVYVLEDGVVKNLSINYSPDYNESEADWTVVRDNTFDNEANVAKDITYKNADTGAAGEDLEISLTQTLFNADANWEYISTLYENFSFEVPSSVSSGSPDEDGKVKLTRMVYVYTPIKGLGIYSEDGNVIATVSADHVNTPESYVDVMRVRGIWRIDGKHYLEVEKELKNRDESKYDGYSYVYSYALYLLGEGTLDARKVLEYVVPGEQDNTIFDLNGRQLSEKPASGYYIQGGKKYYTK